MRILSLFIILLISYIPTYAIEYTHEDGSHISVSLPSWVPDIVLHTIENTLEKILPSKNTILPIPTTTPNTNLESEHIDTTNWEHTITVKKIFTNNKISSLLINSYEYTGGAHGSSARIGIVIDNTSGKVLSLDDLYDTKKLVKRLAPIWQKQIRSQLERSLEKKLSTDEKDWIRDGTSDIQQYQSFVITPTLLIVYGQQYQHNAYAYGMQTLIYPRSKLSDIAK